MDNKKTNFALRLTIEQNEQVMDMYKKIIEEKDKQIELLLKQIASMREVHDYFDMIISRQEAIIHAHCILKDAG